MDDLFGIDDENNGILSRLDDEVVVDKRLWPKDLALLSEAALSELQAAGVKDQQAWLLMEKMLVAVSMRCGGKGYYLPKGDRLRKGIRNRRIYLEHDGSTHGENGIKALSERYRLSENKIYEIIREQRQIRINKVQTRMDI